MGTGFEHIVMDPVMVVVVPGLEVRLPVGHRGTLATLDPRHASHPVLLLLVALVALSACGEDEGSNLAPDADPGSVSESLGSYVVNGVDPLGTEYGGHLTIIEGEGLNRYQLQWIITGSIQEGTGSLEGNQLLVEWNIVEGLNRDARGTAEYTVTEAGELYGTRTVIGSDEVGTEEAFPND